MTAVTGGIYSCTCSRGKLLQKCKLLICESMGGGAVQVVLPCRGSLYHQMILPGTRASFKPPDDSPMFITKLPVALYPTCSYLIYFKLLLFSVCD